MSRSLLLLILGLVVVIGLIATLGGIDTHVSPKPVEKDMLNEAAAQ